MFIAEQILNDIVGNLMSVGYFEQSSRWSASMMCHLPCGCNHVVQGYGQELQLAVERCLKSREMLVCDCKEADDE